MPSSGTPPSPHFQTFERFGIPQAGYHSNRRDRYFEDAVEARRQRDALIAAAGVDPLAKAMARMREDDRTVPRGSYIYDRALVDGARSARLQPNKGDLLLINSRCYHEVERARSDRVTYAAFVGLLPDGRFVVWA